MTGYVLCPCIAYEPSEDYPDTLEPCECGHAEDQHDDDDGCVDSVEA